MDLLRRLLDRLLQFNVRINASKSIFAADKIPYLGYCLNSRGIVPDEERISTVLNADKPSTVVELRSFLCFMQYYSKFIGHFSSIAEPLFQVLTEDTFFWGEAQDRSYRSLIDCLKGEPVLRSFNPAIRSRLVVDASEYGLGGVLEQESRPVICISRRLSKSEINYSQTQKEALAIHWALRRLHKYLFNHRFTFVTDHEALKHLFHPDKSLQKCTSSMLQRWAVEMSSYDYEIEHVPGKRIPQADYLSRGAYQAPPTDDDVCGSCLCVQPLPLCRNILIEETKSYYGSVLSSFRNGWSVSAKKKFVDIYTQREEMSLDPDGIILIKDRVLIPPTCRQQMLEHLHKGHIGKEKMLSLARMICWWPHLSNDIQAFLRQCTACLQKPRSDVSWKPWPASIVPMQRVHVDYCGPLINSNYYALIIIDSFSKYPEVFLTEHATAEFTQAALRKFFAREGIAQVLVSDNGTHFTAHELQSWLRKIGVTQVFTAPRRPQSNGQAENFVKSFKSAMKAMKPTTFTQLDHNADTFLMQYRNTAHCMTKKSPALLFKGRNLRTCTVVDSTHVSFFRGNDNRPCEGIMLNMIGDQMLNVMDKSDGSVHRRHRQQVIVTPSSAIQDVIRTNIDTEATRLNVHPLPPVEEPVVLEPVVPEVYEPNEPGDDDLDITLPMLQSNIPITSTPCADTKRKRFSNPRYKDFV
jgi:transposase InsO family protein